MSDYIRNQSTLVWERPGFDGIAYSDGEEVEARLLAAVRECADLSSGSAELLSQVTDWPSEYHLSPVRHNLLRPIAFRPTDRVLELGCGCGAITRFLGESGAAVLAVEGSGRRAQIAAQRCRDLPGVRVACDNLASFETSERFDVVTLIGVLEYARRFIDAGDPVLECLRRAGSWLTEGGVLILAIENQLGLKYFGACAEDHLDRPYFGIEDLYGERTAVTFGRRQLAALLGDAGFGQQQWLFPYPDYKLARVIVSEKALHAADFNLPSLLFRTSSRDYRGSRLRAFDESLARRAVWRNGLSGDLANSFLVMARRGDARPPEIEWLARAYSGARHRAYCTVTSFHRDAAGQVRVERSYAFPGSAEAPPPRRFSHRLVSENYARGPLLIERLHALARTQWSSESLTEWARPWAAFLAGSALAGDPATVPPHYIDCTPFNCVEAGPGRLVYIDAEWSADGPIPLRWVFIRGLAYSLGDLLQPDEHHLERRALVTDLGRRLAIPVTDADFQLAEEWETAFQAHCRPLQPGRRVLAEMLDTPAGGNVSVFGALDSAHGEIEKMKNSRSWRITRPLRRTLDFFRRGRKARRP